MAVLICGSIAYDNIMVFRDRFKDHILPDKIHILNVAFQVSEMRREFGGCAGNIAYGFTLLGGSALPMATIGGSDFASYADWMDSNGITRSYLKAIDDAYTAQAFIITDSDGNQITIFHPGAMAFSHKNSIKVAEDVALGIVSPDSYDGMKQHASDLAEEGTPFLFDPGQGMAMFHKEDLDIFLEQASWVAVNSYEWEMLRERTGFSASQVLERVQALIVTQGAEGSVIHTRQGSIEIPALPVRQAVDPTGCGDAYRAGILHGLSNSMDWETTGRIATLMGAINVQYAGTQNYRFVPDDFKDRFEKAFGYVF